MKKIFLISAAMVLLFASCKSNTQGNKELNGTTDGVDSTTATTYYTIPEITEPVAFQVWKLIADGEYECPADCTLEYFYLYDKDEGFFASNNIYCYPYKDGGYLAIHKYMEAAEGQGGEYRHNFYNFKDGVLTKIENPIPLPNFIDLIVGEEMRRGQDDIVDKLSELYKENPRGLLNYFYSPSDGILVTQLYPLSYSAYLEPDKNGNCRWLEQFWEMVEEDSDKLRYIWDGSGFVESTNR